MKFISSMFQWSLIFKRNKSMVFIDRWSFYAGGHYIRYDQY